MTRAGHADGGRRRPLSDIVVEDLRGRIVSGEISPGDRLPSESELTVRHGVSRTVVREAISRLQAEGLVNTRRGSGSFALTPPPSEVAPTGLPAPRTLAQRRELLAFRIGVETEAAALAALHRTPQALAMLDRALVDFDAASTSPSGALLSDFGFHRAVAEASRNSYLLRAISDLGPTMIAMPRHRLAPPDGGGVAADRLVRVATEHRAVRDAIAEQDPSAAAAAMRVHLANSRRRLEAEAGNASS